MRLFTSNPPVLKLARHGKWDAVEAILQETEDPSTIRDACPNFLHQLLRHRPPVHVVDLALTKLRSPDVILEEQRDDKGRTPLHVAVAHGCDARIVKLLVSGVAGAMPARMRDGEGNTPLHTACGAPFDAFRRYSARNALAALSNATETVTRLLQAHPEATVLPNNRGETPLQLAREAHADPRILNRIEFAQQAHEEGTKITSETFKTPFSSNEFSIVSRPQGDDEDDGVSSVGFNEDDRRSTSSIGLSDGDNGDGSSVPLSITEVKLSVRPEAGEVIQGMSLPSE